MTASNQVEQLDANGTVWVERWSVPSKSNPNQVYIVARNAHGEFACSCPVWKFRRQTCKHIQQVQNQLARPVLGRAFLTEDAPVEIRPPSRVSLIEI